MCVRACVRERERERERESRAYGERHGNTIRAIRRIRIRFIFMRVRGERVRDAESQCMYM